MRKKKRGRKNRHLIRVLVSFLAGAGIAVPLVALYGVSGNRQEVLPPQENRKVYRTVEWEGEKYRYNTDLINILCIGVDADDIGLGGQADSIFLLILDRGEKRMQIISISRDCVVPIQVFDPSNRKVGWTKDHLALSYAYGETVSAGSLLTAEAVSAMFHDIPVIYYATASLTAIPRFQSLAGEFTVLIPGNDLEYLGEEFKKGNQMTLCADNAELFLRSRDTGENFSNTGRMQRQKVYLEAYVRRMKELLQLDFAGTLEKISALQNQLGTNIALEETEAFVQMLMTYRCDFRTDYHMVEGMQQEGVFHDDYIVDEEALTKLVLNIFYKKERK